MNGEMQRSRAELVKQCISCKVDVEKVPRENDGYAFFNIVQATTVMITSYGNKSAKRQSTSYVCDACIASQRIEWHQLIHTTWTDEIRMRGNA